jgi:hypothetical protein
MNISSWKIISAVLLLTAFNATASKYYVNNVNGSDTYSGQHANTLAGNGPFKTIAKAIRKISPGDTLIIQNSGVPYTENIRINNLKCTKNNPIIIDGQMSTLRGSKPLKIEEWKNVGPSLYRKHIVLKENILARYFMVMDGNINRMGRILKGKSAPLKKISNLLPGEWTYVKSEKALYVKLPKGTKISKANIMEPVLRLTSGVQISGNCSFVTVRNLAVEFFWNDGFNIHGNCSSIDFTNILARYNGDDGISAHETCFVNVKNYISECNGTGICHVGNSITTAENVLITNTVGVDLLLKNRSNTMKNIIALSSNPTFLRIRCRQALLENLKIINLGQKPVPAVLDIKELCLKNCLFQNFSVQIISNHVTGKIIKDFKAPEYSDAFAFKIYSSMKKIFGKEFPQNKNFTDWKKQ